MAAAHVTCVTEENSTAAMLLLRAGIIIYVTPVSQEKNRTSFDTREENERKKGNDSSATMCSVSRVYE